MTLMWLEIFQDVILRNNIYYWCQDKVGLLLLINTYYLLAVNNGIINDIANNKSQFVGCIFLIQVCVS